MKRFALLTLAIAALSYPAGAQANLSATQNPYLGANVTREYRAEDLTSNYGILDISVGDIWVVTLPDDVTDVITSREGVLQFNRTGNRVIMGALASSGAYPILIVTADRMYFFQARLTPSKGGGMRNVIVKADAVQQTDQRLNAFPQAPAAPVPAFTPVPAPAPAVTPVQSVKPAPAPAITPAAPKPQATTSRGAVPEVQASVDFRAYTDQQTTRVYYRVTNRSVAPITLNEQTLTVRNGDMVLPFQGRVSPMTVQPGETVYGDVEIPTHQPALNISWSVRDAITGGQLPVTATLTAERLN